MKKQNENLEKQNSIIPNMNYANLKDSYLFAKIGQKVREYSAKNPDKKILKLGIGDVSLPLCSEVIKALHSAVDDQSQKSTFHGYMNECGFDELRRAVLNNYLDRKIKVDFDEVFISSGASDELGDILDLFDKKTPALIIEPAYPAYVDASIIAGRKIFHLPSSIENGFLPRPNFNISVDSANCNGNNNTCNENGVNCNKNCKTENNNNNLNNAKIKIKEQAYLIYICSPNNPTGAVFSKDALKEWVDFANKTGSVILFDGAYEIFIQDNNLPRSIFEIEGAKTCAIEICSLSKTAGFTGTRLGYTIIPKELVRCNMNLNAMWVRNRTTKTNGVSYIIQKGALAVFSKEGQKQIRENIEIYKNNAKNLSKVLDELGIWYTGGKNSPYIWLKCPLNMSSWQFFDYLLENIQVVGTPGEGFGKCGEGYFRFSMFGSNEDSLEASKRLKNLLQNACRS